MFIVARALTYASLFIGFFLVFVPRRLIADGDLSNEITNTPPKLAGLALSGFGFALAVACVLSFAFRGRGTPAPFDPPTRLVAVGPYRYVRNPMYVGAVLALFGAAVFWLSKAVLAYAIGFALCCHLFVVLFEEPTLRNTFGVEYENYRRDVHRWLPRIPTSK
jgi:protein-S-isoprenylcysteine O-methyltransferase Ste14